MGIGPLSGQMAAHIVLMNLLAPLVALLLGRRTSRRVAAALGPATLVQLLLLWALHLPGVTAAAYALLPHAAMQALLFAAALWFWLAVFATAGERRWRALLALLVTSKLFCLLGVLLTFAPRPLYEHGTGHAVTMADQQLAGLLMIVACPASYLLAAVVIAVRWLRVLERDAAESTRAVA